MKLNKKFVQELFRNLEIGQQDQFFGRVSANVLWQVMGTHPLAGIYHSKQDFIDHTFSRLNKVLKHGPILKVNNIIIAAEESIAIVEMRQLSTTVNNKPFDNYYCWIVKFENDVIVEVRAYLDSTLVKELMSEATN